MDGAVFDSPSRTARDEEADNKEDGLCRGRTTRGDEKQREGGAGRKGRKSENILRPLHTRSDYEIRAALQGKSFWRNSRKRINARSKRRERCDDGDARDEAKRRTAAKTAADQIRAELKTKRLRHIRGGDS